MTKQFKAIGKKELAKLSIKERQDYSEAPKKHLTENAELMRQALIQGVKEKVKTL